MKRYMMAVAVFLGMGVAHAAAPIKTTVFQATCAQESETMRSTSRQALPCTRLVITKYDNDTDLIQVAGRAGVTGFVFNKKGARVEDDGSVTYPLLRIYSKGIPHSVSEGVCRISNTSAICGGVYGDVFTVIHANIAGQFYTPTPEKDAKALQSQVLMNKIATGVPVMPDEIDWALGH